MVARLRWGVLGLLLAAIPARADVVVPRAGAPVRGAARIDEAQGRVVIGDDARPFGDVLLVEKDDGTFVFAPSFDARLAGYRRLAALGRRDKLVELAQEAVRAGDAATARRLYEWVRDEGLDGKDERILRKRLESLEKRPREINEKRIVPVLREEGALREAGGTFLYERARLDDGPDALRLLREALRERPMHAEALGLLGKRVPAENPFGDARAWLDWHVDLESRGFRLAPESMRELKQARFEWRPDLFGVLSDEVLILTPIRRQDVLAACALRARAAVRTLAELFATPEPYQRAEGPLVVYLFADAKNFAEHAGYATATELAPYFHWRGGHFSAAKDRTWLLCPDAFTDALGFALVHEIAGHWLWSRCPRYTSTDLARAEMVSGYGPAIGLVGMLAEAPFDAGTETFDLAVAQTKSTRLVRAVKPAWLVPWSRLFLMDLQDVHLQNTRDPVLDGKGEKGQPPFAAVFAAQATVVCRYLFQADDGRHRGALIDYVTNHYRGDRPKLAPNAAFGGSAEEIGAAALLHAAAAK